MYSICSEGKGRQIDNYKKQNTHADIILLCLWHKYFMYFT